MNSKARLSDYCCVRSERARENRNPLSERAIEVLKKILSAAIIAAAAIGSNVALRSAAYATTYYQCRMSGNACKCASGDYFINYTTCAHDLSVLPGAARAKKLAEQIPGNADHTAKTIE